MLIINSVQHEVLNQTYTVKVASLPRTKIRSNKHRIVVPRHSLSKLIGLLILTSVYCACVYDSSYRNTKNLKSDGVQFMFLDARHVQKASTTYQVAVVNFSLVLGMFRIILATYGIFRIVGTTVH